MITLFNDLLFFMIVIFFHESGHYIYFLCLGLKPSIKFKNGGILMGENIKNQLKIWQFVFISFGGILLGCIPIIIFQPNLKWFFIYYAVCTIDIASLHMIDYKKWNEKIEGG
jgi:hypothetical protein